MLVSAERVKRRERSEQPLTGDIPIRVAHGPHLRATSTDKVGQCSCRGVIATVPSHLRRARDASCAQRAVHAALNASGPPAVSQSTALAVSEQSLTRFRFGQWTVEFHVPFGNPRVLELLHETSPLILQKAPSSFAGAAYYVAASY